MKKYTKTRPKEWLSGRMLATRQGQEWSPDENLVGRCPKLFSVKGSWKMKLSVVLLSTALLQLPMPIQAQKITLNLKDASISQIFQQMERQSGYSFFYKDVDVADFKRRGVSFRNTDLNQALESILSPYGLDYEIVNKTVVIKRAVPAKGGLGSSLTGLQTQKHTGTVTDEQGNPISGALVTLKGSRAVVSTTTGGSFAIDAKEGDELIISHVSYFSKTVKVGNAPLSVVLQANDNLIEQVVVTGYTDYKKGKSASATSSVQAKDIGGVPMGSLDQVLQGKVPGMSVVSSSGQPGQSANVVIRGIGSIRGTTTPLYVMDGVPIEGNYFQTINPEDIENVSVLKDASAKALYGSRGSNGVVVITTKKGKQGRLSVNYSSQYGFSTLTRTAFEMMDSRERLRFEEEVGLETGRDIGPGWRLSPRNPSYNTQSAAWQQDAKQALDSLRNMDTDWRDLFFQDGRFMEQQLSLSGGNENVQTYNSLSLWNEDGIVKETGMNRYTLRSNTNMNYGRFTAGINLSLGYSNSRFTYNEGGTGVGSPMASVYYALPYEYPYTADGVFYATDTDHPFYDTREGSRGIDVLYGTSNKTNQFKTILGLNMAYELMPGLKLSTRAGVDFRNSEDQIFVNPLSYLGQNQFGKKGSFEEGYRRNFNLVSTSGLTYNKTVDLHDFEVSGFFEYIQSNYKRFGYKGYGLDDRLPESPKAITVSPSYIPDLVGDREAQALLSYMGVGRYTYDNKYTLTGSYRYDGASLASVPNKNRWHGFYSFGAAWDAKQENILRDNDFIPVLRLRASYGQTASPLAALFSHMSLFSVNTSYGGQSAIRPANLANPDSDWEYVNEFNTGFDMGLFRGQRLNLTVDFYNKITRNMFLNLQPSATAGMGSGVTIPLSSGKMGNKGVEFALNGDVIKSKDITWNVGINGAYNQNKILRVSDVSDELMDGDTRIIKVGLPYGTYYGPQWAGVNPDNGDAQYYNSDGSITNVYNSDGQSVPLSANMFPKFTGGITTSFRCKDLTLNALLSFVSDVERWNNIDF